MGRDHSTDESAVDVVLALARRARPRCGETVVVAIDGRSGAGKTTLGAATAARLDCPLVHMDEIYPGWEGLAASVPLLVEQVLAPRARGERVVYRCWDWVGQRPGVTKEVAPGPFLVVEGCGSSVMPAGAYAAVRVWMEAPRALRRARGLARDGAAFECHWQRWAEQEDEVFAHDGTASRADLVIDTGPAGEAQVADRGF